MDSIALQLAIRYATKSGKITLAQKITDELIEQKKEKEIQRSSSPPISSYSSSTISISSASSTFEEIKQIRPKVSTSNGPFSNPFRKKNLTNSNNEPSTTDELSKWKPSINKSRLVKTPIQVELIFSI
jgi:hypothetical protein